MPETQVPLLTTEWARLYGVQFHWHTPLDNYSPARADTHGIGWRYDIPESDGGWRRQGIVLDDVSELRDAHDAIYLIDNGRVVAPYYAAGWHPDRTHLIIQPFPLSVGRRPDNGRPVDMSGWVLGPRRAYHLKVVS